MMSETPEQKAGMRAVTVSREYGSGGGEIARQLAERLGWHLIDHEVVGQVAQKLGISEEEAKAHDERTEGYLSRLLMGMQAVVPSFYPVVYEDIIPLAFMTDPHSYRDALDHVVKAALKVGQVVIVGRGGQALLHDRRDVLHIRIVATLEQRIPYVMRREGLDEPTARARIQSKDHERERYLQSEYRCHPANAHLYDLVLNTNILTLGSIVDLIMLALELKARQLTTSTGALGPVAGQEPYSGQPADFQPPGAESVS